MLSRVLAIAAYLLLSAGCSHPGYRAPAAGYELRPSFMTAYSHEEFHMERSPLGPVDVGATRFVFPKDAVVGGAGEAYLAIGLHGAFELPRDDATLVAFADGFAQGAAMNVGAIAARRRIDSPRYLGTEVVIDGTHGEHANRTLHARLLVAPQGLYILIAAIDREYATQAYFANRRTSFFDSFHLTPLRPSTPSGADRQAMTAAGELVERLFSRGSS